MYRKYTPNIALFKQKMTGRYWALCCRNCGIVKLADPKDVDRQVAPFVLKKPCGLCKKKGQPKIYKFDPISERLQVIRNAEVAIGRRIKASETIYLMDGDPSNIQLSNISIFPEISAPLTDKIDFKTPVIGGNFWCQCPGPCEQMILKSQEAIDRSDYPPVSINPCKRCIKEANA